MVWRKNLNPRIVRVQHWFCGFMFPRLVRQKWINLGWDCDDSFTEIFSNSSFLWVYDWCWRLLRKLHSNPLKRLILNSSLFKKGFRFCIWQITEGEVKILALVFTSVKWLRKRVTPIFTIKSILLLSCFKVKVDENFCIWSFYSVLRGISGSWFLSFTR